MLYRLVFFVCDFSIIIPVYKIEEYIEECVNSILPALNKSFDEIIFVVRTLNDASIDLIHKLNFVNSKIIIQDGIGLSNARNCGLKYANGKYIIFLDGDDFADTNVMRDLLNGIRNKKYFFDIVITDFYVYNPNINKTKLIQQFGRKKIIGLSKIIEEFSHRECFWNVWRCIYRKDFLLENKICFLENAYAEDLDFTIRVFLNDPNTVFIPAAYYHYRLGRDNSLMNSTSFERVYSTFNVIENDINLLKKSHVAWKRKIIDRLQFEYILNLAIISDLSLSQKKKVYDIVNLKILQPTSDFIVYIIVIMIKIFGVARLSSMLSIIKRLKRKKEKRAI